MFYNTRRVVEQFQVPVINILIEEQQSQQKHENDISDGMIHKTLIQVKAMATTHTTVKTTTKHLQVLKDRNAHDHINRIKVYVLIY